MTESFSSSSSAFSKNPERNKAIITVNEIEKNVKEGKLSVISEKENMEQELQSHVPA